MFLKVNDCWTGQANRREMQSGCPRGTASSPHPEFGRWTGELSARPFSGFYPEELEQLAHMSWNERETEHDVL